ncbi:MAG: hypothetical protein JWO11_3208 [Nocardioides sp.]|nr:hypothetical protein [Nocardioides sp.]
MASVTRCRAIVSRRRRRRTGTAAGLRCRPAARSRARRPGRRRCGNLSPQVLLVVGVTNRALTVAGSFINTCRLGLGPRTQTLAHVQQVLVPVDGQTNVREGAFAGFEVPELGIDQNTVMVEEDVLLHSRDSSPTAESACPLFLRGGSEERMHMPRRVRPRPPQADLSVGPSRSGGDCLR